MFHLFTHAFFKALLFLSAGSVMHSMGDVIDMRRFGGLRRVLPITHWTFLVRRRGAGGRAAALRVFGARTKSSRRCTRQRTCAEHAGVLLVDSWRSRRSRRSLTAFYTFRAYFLTFWGEERFPDEAGHHPHDAPPVMAWPLRILAVFALFIGAIGRADGVVWRATCIMRSDSAKLGEEGFVVGLVALSVAVVVAGIGLAWFMYIASRRCRLRWRRRLGRFISCRSTSFISMRFTRRSLSRRCVGWRGCRIGSIGT